jgi:hypothetical protein
MERERRRLWKLKHKGNRVIRMFPLLRAILVKLGVLVLGRVVRGKMSGAGAENTTPPVCTKAPKHSAKIAFRVSWCG